jgi:Ca2+-binding EF-hand superfamily protein
MKTLWKFGVGALAFGLTAVSAQAQQAGQQPGQQQAGQQVGQSGGAGFGQQAGQSGQSGQMMAQRRPGDLPGPIDSLQDLQDTGRMVFKLADENNDGQISQKEAVDAGNLLVGGFFFRADQNGDGKLTQDEARQAREAFMSSKPWLRYVVETARTAKTQQGNNAQQGNNSQNQNMLAGLAAAFDTNNDKALEASELRQAVNTAVQGAFSTADTNRDGQLSPTELNASIAGVARQVAQATFRQADSDGNGQISQAEFEKAIIGPARVAFQVMDLNHDGQLSEQEAQTARQLVISRLRSSSLPEAPNSPRNMINQAIGSQSQPGGGQSNAPR